MRLLRAIDHFSRFLGLASGQLYFLCAIITTYEVVMRYVFSAPTQWAFEVVMVLCASAWLMSSGYVTLYKRHIAITVIYLVVPRKVQWALELFGMVVGLAVTLTLAYAAWEPAATAVSLIERTGSAFNSPQPTILKSMLVFGALLYAVQLAVNIVRHLRSRRDGG